MKLSVEGSSEEIKEILLAICNSREISNLINIENLNESIVTPSF